ncbi:hypothetical protein MKLM6_4374 (plasmid) [Methylomonas koyamae]|nr:hypothetical protein MKLM6_4374 [Methylomonas koyamae]
MAAALAAQMIILTSCGLAHNSVMPSCYCLPRIAKINRQSALNGKRAGLLDMSFVKARSAPLMVTPMKYHCL